MIFSNVLAHFITSSEILEMLFVDVLKKKFCFLKKLFLNGRIKESEWSLRMILDLLYEADICITSTKCEIAIFRVISPIAIFCLMNIYQEHDLCQFKWLFQIEMLLKGYIRYNISCYVVSC